MGNDLARKLYAARSVELDDLYRARADKRALHFQDFAYKTQLWAGEAAASFAYPSHSPGTASYNATRDGKCAEMVMWFSHHIAESKRSSLAAASSFELPLMPKKLADGKLGGHEYQRQITCTDCHVRIQNPTKPEIVTPPPVPAGSGPQYPEFCDANGKKKPV